VNRTSEYMKTITKQMQMTTQGEHTRKGLNYDRWGQRQKHNKDMWQMKTNNNTWSTIILIPAGGA